MDEGDLPCDPRAEGVKNLGFVTWWKRLKLSQEVQLYGRLHSDICSVTRLLFPASAYSSD